MGDVGNGKALYVYLLTYKVLRHNTSKLHKATYCHQMWLEEECPCQFKPLHGEQSFQLESCYAEEQYLLPKLAHQK